MEARQKNGLLPTPNEETQSEENESEEALQMSQNTVHIQSEDVKMDIDETGNASNPPTPSGEDEGEKEREEEEEERNESDPEETAHPGISPQETKKPSQPSHPLT